MGRKRKRVLREKFKLCKMKSSDSIFNEKKVVVEIIYCRSLLSAKNALEY